MANKQATALKNHAKDWTRYGSREGTFYLVELDKNRGRWVGTSYFACQTGMATLELLSSYNLPTDQAGMFSVNGTVTATEAEPPRLGQLVPLDTEGHHDAEPMTTPYGPALVNYHHSGKERLLRLFTIAGETVGARHDYLSFCESEAAVVRWVGKDNNKALVGLAHDGRIAAVVMPVKAAR